MDKATAFKQFLGSEGAEVSEIEELVSENPQLIAQLEEAPELAIPVLLGLFAQKIARRKSYTKPKQVAHFVRTGPDGRQLDVFTSNYGEITQLRDPNSGWAEQTPIYRNKRGVSHRRGIAIRRRIFNGYGHGGQLFKSSNLRRNHKY